MDARAAAAEPAAVQRQEKLGALPEWDLSDLYPGPDSEPLMHDLSALAGQRLRTHGGLAESRVPFILNRPLNAAYAARAARGSLRNFHIFDFAINGMA